MTVNIAKEKLLPVELNQLDRIAFAQKMQRAREVVLNKIARNLDKFGDSFPAETCEQGH